MGKEKSLKHGEARLEFVACRARVEEMLSQGYSISSIHAALTQKGIITMSYKTLQDKINKIGKAPRGTSTVKQPAPSQGREFSSSSPGMQLKELDEAMALAAAQRGGASKKSDDAKPAYDREDVIG